MKKFLWPLDYVLLPFVFAVVTAILIKGVFSQIDFFSDLLTNTKINYIDDCLSAVGSEYCGISGKYFYSYEFPRPPFLRNIFGHYYLEIFEIRLYVLFFEALLVAYVCFRVRGFMNLRNQ